MINLLFILPVLILLNNPTGFPKKSAEPKILYAYIYINKII